MIDNKLTSNSTGSTERKKVEKVADGKVKQKTGVEKALGSFFSEDITNIKEYIISDVLVPTIKKTIHDIITNGVDILLYGEKGAPARKSTSDYISYRTVADKNRYSSGTTSSISSGRQLAIDEISFTTRGEAEEVLNRMDEIIDQYGTVSVTDLYDLAGATCDYTYRNYGWDSVRYAEVVRVRDGYKIRLPKAVALK